MLTAEAEASSKAVPVPLPRIMKTGKEKVVPSQPHSLPRRHSDPIRGPCFIAAFSADELVMMGGHILGTAVLATADLLGHVFRNGNVGASRAPGAGSQLRSEPA